jgi:hypothetical protein
MGKYTDNGHLRTRVAYEAAISRASKAGLLSRIVEVAFSYDWLDAKLDGSSSHCYDGAR